MSSTQPPPSAGFTTLANRGDVPPFMVMDVMARAAAIEAQGRRVIHMEVGQPSTPAPEGVRERAKAAIDGELLGYTLATGTPTLRRAIADHYQRRYALAVDPARIVVTAGSLGAFHLLFMALFEAGDRIALPLPCYPSYRNMLAAQDLTAVYLPTRADNGFQPTPELLDKIAEPIRGLIIASPSNPVGSMIPPDELQRLADYCHGRGIWLISDEIYHGLTYGVQELPAIACTASAISVNSFSKYFSMTGWRLGWMVLPEHCLRQVERLAQNFYICPSAVAQYAAEAAFECDAELQRHVANYARNRAYLLAQLPALGFDRLAPADGAFYLYADVSHLCDDSAAFAAALLAEAGVAVTPGVDFDPLAGERSWRFSYARSFEDMVEAVARIARWRGLS